MVLLRIGCTRVRSRLTAIFFVIAAPTVAHTQEAGAFVAVGAGASLPSGGADDAMDPGWVAHLMGGRVLPGEFASARIGIMYGRSRVPGLAGGMGTSAPAMSPGTQEMVAVLGGLMAMPRWDYDWFPYVFADAGALTARLRGRITSFAWSSGVGTTLQWSAVDFQVEGRFLQARHSGTSGEMFFVTVGIRFSR